MKLIFVLIAILAGLYALFAVSPNTEIALGFFSLTFGLLAIFWTTSAYRNLSPRSTLRNYTALFLMSLIFILANSVWATLIVLFEIGGIANYVGYFLTSAAYVTFVIAAYKILSIGKEFGFREQSSEISRALRKKSKH